MPDNTQVAETEALMLEKLEETGRLDKIRAMVAEAGYQALQETDTEGSLFTDAPELLEVRTATGDAAAKGMVPFRVVTQWLRYMGLNHTASLLALEAGKLPAPVEADDEAVAASVPGSKADSEDPVLSQLLRGGCGSQPSTPAKAPATAPAPVTAVAKSEAAPAPVAPVVTTAAAAPKVTEVVVTKKGKETKYEIYGWDGGVFTRFNEIDGQPLNMWECRNVKVFVYDAVDSITLDECEDCELFVAACENSIFLRDCKRMKVTAACKQLRLRDCEHMDLRLFGQTDPVVEKSFAIDFKPFNARAPLLRQKLQQVRLDPKQNRFLHVYDFTPDYDTALPHYTVKLLAAEHGLEMEDFGEELGTPEAPVEVQQLLRNDIEPASSSESGKNKSHDIKQDHKLWEKEEEVEEKQEEPVKEEPKKEEPKKEEPKPAAGGATGFGVGAAKPAAMTLSRDSDSSYSSYDSTPMSSAKGGFTDSDDEF